MAAPLEDEVFFRQQQAEKHEQNRMTRDLVEGKKAPPEENLEDEDTDSVDGQEDALARDYEHRPEERQPPLSPPTEQSREKAGSEDLESVWLLRADRDTERCVDTQWRQKARYLHHQLQEAKQSYRNSVTMRRSKGSSWSGKETQYGQLAVLLVNRNQEICPT
ncbi:hypothetical protein V7S43_007288 [Phytophthora oleae]|uniref:Uncharacterized protein n=1 Tax=Phytophthora oleae TaxID=2107226 RepID=A0ABD3FQ15_9STRA